MRLPARCASDWYTRAVLKGSLKLVDTVQPKPILLATRLRAAFVVVGSRRDCIEGWSLGADTRLSARKNRSNLPRSAIFTPASAMGQLQLLSKAPGLRQPAM